MVALHKSMPLLTWSNTKATWIYVLQYVITKTNSSMKSTFYNLRGRTESPFSFDEDEINKLLQLSSQ